MLATHEMRFGLDNLYSMSGEKCRKPIQTQSPRSKIIDRLLFIIIYKCFYDNGHVGQVAIQKHAWVR